MIYWIFQLVNWEHQELLKVGSVCLQQEKLAWHVLKWITKTKIQETTRVIQSWSCKWVNILIMILPILQSLTKTIAAKIIEYQVCTIRSNTTNSKHDIMLLLQLSMILTNVFPLKFLLMIHSGKEGTVALILSDLCLHLI